MRPTRREVAWLSLSFALWAFVALHLRGTWHSVNEGGDHWAHYGYSQVFLEHGFEIYEQPASAFCTAPATEAVQRFKDVDQCRAYDVCVLRDHPERRPLCITWQWMALPYPPGMLLYSLPEGLLYRFTSLSFGAVNLLAILKLLAAAQLLIWMVYRTLFAPPSQDDLPGGVEWEASNPVLRWGLFGLIYLEIIQWSLDGFYDPLPIFIAFWGVYFVIKRRGLDAILALSTALFFHFRTLWLLPLFFCAAAQLLSGREWTQRRATLKITVSAALLAPALYSFWLVRPWIRHFPWVNPVLWAKFSWDSAPFWSFALPVLVVLGYLAWGRCWLLLATLAWQSFMVIQTPQTMLWHPLFLLPIFLVARREGKRGAMFATFVFYVVETVVVFDNLPLGGRFIAALLKHWAPLHL